MSLLLLASVGAAPLIGTHYFYWYNIDTKSHVFDLPSITDDALQSHPINLLLSPLNVQDSAWPKFSGLDVAWHEQQLRDIHAAGIEAIFPIYWGDTGNRNAWALAGLPALVQAARNLEQGGETPARIGMFFDTSAIALQMGNNFSANLTTTQAYDVMYAMVHDFFSAIPQDLWALSGGKPIIVTYSRFSYTYNQATWNNIFNRFQAEFGVRPHIVLDDSWPSATGDTRCLWGAAPFGPVVHANDANWASVGPGFNNSAVPGGNLIRDREDALYYQNGWITLLNQTPANKPGVLVETWNELHEGSDIAHTHEYGRRYINITRFYTDLLRTNGSTGKNLTVAEVDGVNQIYWRLLKRGPEATAVVPAALGIKSAGGNRQNYALSVLNSEERRRAFIADAYRQYLGQNATEPDQQQMLGLYATGNDKTVLAAILSSATFWQRSGQTNEKFTDQLYRTLCGRWPTMGERNAALQELSQSGNRLTVAQHVLNSSGYNQVLARQLCSALAGGTTDSALLTATQQTLAGATPEAASAQVIAGTAFGVQSQRSFGRDELQQVVTISGRVSDFWNDQALAGADVGLYDVNGSFIAGALTDSSATGNNFSITVSSRSGAFFLRASSSGYREVPIPVALDGPEDVHVNIALKQRQNLTLNQSIDAAMQSLTLVSIDPDQDYEPYHGFYLHADGHAENAHAVEIGIPHMVGRALDALTAAESVRGTAIPTVVEQNLTRHLFNSFNNPDHLNSYVANSVRKVEFHNMREGLAGLNALIAHRGNSQAVTVGSQMLQKLAAITNPDGSFSDTLIAQQGVAANGSQNGPAPGHSGRLVAELMKYYRETADPLALNLADKYANHALTTAFTDGGTLIGAALEPGAGNHVHSITSTLSSLLSWAHDTQLNTTSSLQATNLITNPGWDAQTGNITLSNNFNNGTTFTGWQAYAIGGTPAGSSTFRAQASAQAVTPPNLFTFTLNTASDDSALRRDVNPVVITPGHVYRAGVWVRDIDATLNTFNFSTSLFGTGLPDYLGAFGPKSDQAQATWELQETTFLAPSNATLGSWGIRLVGPTASLQLDEAGLYDITHFDRMVNGGFENAARVLDWDISAVGGRVMSAQIAADAAEGSRALYLTQANTAGDGAFGKDANMMPWTGSHAMDLYFQVKDAPTLAAGEYVAVQISAFDSNGAFISAPFTGTRKAGTGGYAAYSEMGILPPTGTTSISLVFRIVDQSGAPIVGDVLIDAVKIFDADEGVSQNAKIEKCRLIFENAFASTLGSSYGWFKEERRDGTTRGEMNCTGDMVQAALWLARSGYPQYYDQADQYIRSFILPVQLLGISSLLEQPLATEDRFLNIRRRAHGCFGFPMPNDRYDEADVHAISALDVTAGTLQAMCEFYRSIYNREAGTTTVNLYYDIDDTNIKIESNLPEVGEVLITSKLAGGIKAFIPAWVPRDQITISVNNTAASFAMQEPYLVGPNLAAGAQLKITFPLVRRSQSETIAGRDYQVNWLGNQVTEVTPIGGEQPLFQASPGVTQLWGKVFNIEGGTPIEACRVTLLTAGGQELGSDWTDAAGNYAVDIADLPTGNYTARAEKQGYFTISQANVAVESYVPTSLDFNLIAGASLKGTVTKAGLGTAVGGATLQLYNQNTLAATAISQGSGAYLFPTDLNTGTYRLEISAPNYLPQTIQNVSVTYAVSKILNVRLVADEQINLIDNSGWDQTTAQVTLGDNFAETFDNNNSFPTWQVYALGGSPAGNSTFASSPAADAVSGPNVMIFTKNIAPGDSAIRKETPPAIVTPGSVYKTGVWLRDIDGTLNTIQYGTTTFPSVTAALGSGNQKASGAWEKVESIFQVPSGDVGAGLNIRMGEPTGSFQLDSSFLNDVTGGNRLINPGFENSTSRLLGWAKFASGGRALTANLSTIAATGSRALRISQTNTSGDGGVNLDAALAPWQPGRGFKLQIKLRDDPTMGTGERVRVLVYELNAQKQVYASPLIEIFTPGTGAYAAFTRNVEATQASCAWLGIAIRVVNAAGTAVTGDVLVDDVSLSVFEEAPAVETAAEDWMFYQ